jgi:inner membrane protein
MRRALAIGCLATIAAADWTIRERRPRWILIGLADEPAHLATAVLVLLNLPPRPRRDVLAFLAGAVAIDADHIPLALAATQPEAGDPRPRTHTLLVPVALALAGRRAAALGVCAHYLRDVASEAGVPAFAPLSDRRVRVPYPVYAAAMAALALRAGTQSATLSGGL